MKYSKPKKKQKFKRPGRVTKKENAIIKEIVKETPNLGPKEEQALARVFNRPLGTVKGAISRARANIQADAEFYVDAHRSSVEGALATMDFDVARKGAAWAIERISQGGKRLVDKAEVTGPTAGVNVMVGVRLGNVSMQPDVTINAIEGETSED